MKGKQYVGADVHKETVSIGILVGRKQGPDLETVVPNDLETLRKFFKKRAKLGPIEVCYEAGCTGFTLKRLLDEIGIPCYVAAPGKIARRPGDRVKTDRRDALMLARLLRSGEIDPIYIPTKQDEMVRDYLRSRDDLRIDLMRNRQRLQGFLLRHGIKYEEGKKAWSKKHRLWLCKLGFDDQLARLTFNGYYHKVLQMEEQLREMDRTIEEFAQLEPYAEPVAILRCFKGIDYLTAMFFVCEIGDFRRFRTAGEFMSFLGMVPGERSSGNKRRQTGLTKTGNANLRRLLTEAAWHHRRKGVVSKALTERRRGRSPEIIAHADRAANRLNRKFSRMVARGKSGQVTVTAVGRELAGFIWGALNGKVA